MAQKPKPENNSAAYFEPGSAVEVRTHGGLFRGSWFSGTIISRDASDRFLQVEYHNHHNVREFVSLHQLRPLLPPETRHRKFESGEKYVLEIYSSKLSEEFSLDNIPHTLRKIIP
ncbi:hypothetical protein JHK87_025059 [Glycine soja]|nr:hypothetical protein JHK87_025059 [Glycine soja]